MAPAVTDIDPIKFGALVQQVATLQEQMTEMRTDMKEMLALANKGKGGFWAGMAIAAALSSLITWFIAWFTSVPR